MLYAYEVGRAANQFLPANKKFENNLYVYEVGRAANLFLLCLARISSQEQEKQSDIQISELRSPTGRAEKPETAGEKC
ncbi:hypothetical protein ACFXTO_039308 [Malus domestica]